MAIDEVKILLKISGPDLDRDEIIVGRQGLTVGRSNDNKLVLRHREISRQHMRIVWREDDNYQVEDLNSSNGIWLNDHRVMPRVPEILNEGDVIRVGPYLLRYERTIYPEPVVVPPPVTSYSEDHALEPVHVRRNGSYPPGIPRDKSNWLKYLPAIYHDDDFMGRYLLIFESIISPITWMIDNFDMYLDPNTTSQEWLTWIASWFDLLMLPELPIEQQREIMRQMGWLFLRRGTPAGLQRLLELYFGVTPEIIEDEPCHFVVRLPLSASTSEFGEDVAHRLIDSQRPAFATYQLEVT